MKVRLKLPATSRLVITLARLTRVGNCPALHPDDRARPMSFLVACPGLIVPAPHVTGPIVSASQVAPARSALLSPQKLSQFAETPLAWGAFPGALLADSFDDFPSEEQEDCSKPLGKREKLSKTCEFEIKKAEMRERVERVEAQAELKTAALEKEEAMKEERKADMTARTLANEEARAAAAEARAAAAEARASGERGFAIPSMPSMSMPSKPSSTAATPTRTDLGDKTACFWCG